MFGKHSRLKSLQARKRLLLAESELNRAELAREWACLNEEFKSIVQHVQSVGALVSKASVLLAGFAALRRVFSRRNNGKASWLSTVIKGARLGTSLWMAMRSRR